MDMAQKCNAILRRIPTWPVYVLGLLPPLWYFYLGITGELGVEPIKELEHRVGLLALQALIAALIVTPLRKFTGLSLLKFRRAIGLIAFYYVTFHLLVWLLLDVGSLDAIWKDIVKRPFITIGMVSFVLLLPLAVTSNNWSLKKLGAKSWKRLHWLAYPATLLGGIHFVMLVKGWQLESLTYTGIIVVLLAMRLKLPKRRISEQST